MSIVKLLGGRLVDSASPEWQAECLEIHGSAVAIRRMTREMQVHAYETLARTKCDEYADRVRRANALTRGLMESNGMAYRDIQGGKS
jgi:hypothetical protein